ncbi:MAG: hypothetical protein IJ583_04355 [Firmicutes bacterium]|nr:hypothetical protein [Bacillota bacterium]
MKRSYEKPIMDKIEFSSEQIMDTTTSMGGINTYLNYEILDMADAGWYTIK